MKRLVFVVVVAVAVLFTVVPGADAAWDSNKLYVSERNIMSTGNNLLVHTPWDAYVQGKGWPYTQHGQSPVLWKVGSEAGLIYDVDVAANNAANQWDNALPMFVDLVKTTGAADFIIQVGACTNSNAYACIGSNVYMYHSLSKGAYLDESKIYIVKDKANTLTEAQFHKLLGHEFGHWLGMDERYDYTLTSPSCLSSEVSVMELVACDPGVTSPTTTDLSRLQYYWQSGISWTQAATFYKPFSGYMYLGMNDWSYHDTEFRIQLQKQNGGSWVIYPNLYSPDKTAQHKTYNPGAVPEYYISMSGKPNGTYRACVQPIHGNTWPGGWLPPQIYVGSWHCSGTAYYSN